MRLLSLAFFILFAGMVSPLQAQQQEQGEGTLLPEIDPQDIEIRSQFRARFPGLSRQPILGFDPQPRVFQIDPNRMPFMESRDDVVASLPVSQLSRPRPPSYVPMDYAPDINAWGSGGFGNFLTSEARFWGATKFNESKSYVGGDLDYSSAAEGHLEDQPSTFRNLRGNVEFGTKLDPRTQLDLHAGGHNDFNYSPGFPVGRFGPDSSVGRRTMQGLNLGGELRRMRNGVQGWSVNAGIRTFELSQQGGVGEDVTGELSLNGTARYQWAGSHPQETWQVRASARGGFYEGSRDTDIPWHTLGGALVYDRLFNYSTKVTAEAGIYSTYNRAQEGLVRFGGKLNLKHWISDRLTLEASLEARPELATREELSARNRFLFTETGLTHNYRMEGSAEISYTLYDESALYGGVSYRRGDNRPVFLYDQAFSLPSGQLLPAAYKVFYRESTVARLYGGITHALVPERFWFNAEGYVQVPRLQEEFIYHDGDRIPFMENWGISGSLSFRPVDRVTVEGWADLMGSREAALAPDELDAVFLLGARADVEITGSLGVYAKFVNLLSQEYQQWYGFTERPLQVMGGVTLKL